MPLILDKKFIKKPEIKIECGDYFVYDSELYIQSENYGYNLTDNYKKHNWDFILPKEKIKCQIDISYQGKGDKSLNEMNIYSVFVSNKNFNLYFILERTYDEHNIAVTKALNLFNGKVEDFLNHTVLEVTAKISYKDTINDRDT